VGLELTMTTVGETAAGTRRGGTGAQRGREFSRNDGVRVIEGLSEIGIQQQGLGVRGQTDGADKREDEEDLVAGTNG
jgi:hypothetical protein